MRFAPLVPCVCFAFLALGSPPAVGKTLTEPPSYSERVRLFLNATDSPVLFVGRVLKADSNPSPCLPTNIRRTTWSVTKVLFGFDPGKQIDVGFPSCGAVEPQLSSQDEMLVIAYPGYQNLSIGMKQSLVPATNANQLVASNAMDNYLRRSVRELVRPARGRGAHGRSMLAFEGTVVDPGTPRTERCSSTVPPMFPVKFDVGPILQGSWTEKQATVLFAGCRPRPSSPYRRGEPVIVFALVLRSELPIILRGQLLLPSEQLAQAKAGLEAAEAGFAATRSTLEKSLREKIRAFVRSAHEERVSIWCFPESSSVPFLTIRHQFRAYQKRCLRSALSLTFRKS